MLGQKTFLYRLSDDKLKRTPLFSKNMVVWTKSEWMYSMKTFSQ